MKVLIHAPAARMGGARTHVLGLLPELAARAPNDDRFLVLAQPDLLAELPPLPEAWSVLPERAERRGQLGRALWEQRTLPRMAHDWGADVILSFGSFVPLRAGIATVAIAANALPFASPYWAWVRRQSLRVQAQEIGRWALLRASLQAASRVICPTRAMRQDVVTHLPTLADRVDVIPWGVVDHFRDVEWRGPVEPRLLGVSRHALSKELDVLVAALPRLADRWPELRLDLTGTEDETQWARRTASLARRLGVSDRLRYLGDIPRQEVPSLMSAAGLIVFPTWCESFGFPLAESLAVGAPVVTGDIPACREVGADAARYYRPGDPSSLAETIEALLDAPTEAEALARRGRERGRVFRWDENAVATLATLQRAVGQRPMLAVG